MQNALAYDSGEPPVPDSYAETCAVAADADDACALHDSENDVGEEELLKAPHPHPTMYAILFPVLKVVYHVPHHYSAHLLLQSRAGREESPHDCHSGWHSEALVEPLTRS